MLDVSPLTTAEDAGQPQMPQDMIHVSDEDIDAVLNMLHTFQEDLFAYRDTVGEVLDRIDDDGQRAYDAFDLPDQEQENFPTGEMPIDLDFYSHEEPSGNPLDYDEEDLLTVLGVGPQMDSSGNAFAESGLNVTGREESSVLNRPLSTSPPRPPFLTDGRGRVVWSGSGNEDDEDDEVRIGLADLYLS